MMMMMMMKAKIVCEKEVFLLCAGSECEKFRERGVRTLSAVLRPERYPKRSSRDFCVFWFFGFQVLEISGSAAFRFPFHSALLKDGAAKACG